MYSNQLPLDQLKIPPTVLLMDSLNTQTANQQQGRAHMIQLLRTLPPDTPIAVFLLGSSLRILQGFTSDGRLLRAALDQAVTGAIIEQDPRDDTQQPLQPHPGRRTAVWLPDLGWRPRLGEFLDFEKEEYAGTFDLRAKETLGALAQIGQYLSGIPGRKNLIWVSESFPISIAPDPDTGNNSFAGHTGLHRSSQSGCQRSHGRPGGRLPHGCSRPPGESGFIGFPECEPSPGNDDWARDCRPVEP